MAKRPFGNRRRPRPPGIYRIGDRARPDVQAERSRLTLYLTNRHLDLAEALCREEGVSTVQRYCEQLLEEALEAEKARLKVDETEARQGPMEGLREIAEDPEYLAEWNASIESAMNREAPSDEIVVDMSDPVGPVGRVVDVPAPLDSSSFHSVLAHAGIGRRGTGAFIAYLRRGENPPAEVVADLVESLASLSQELEGAAALDRRLAYALHRLAFESQVLATDAFPGAFDADTIHTLRAVQEAVDRILSGEDIRYLES